MKNQKGFITLPILTGIVAVLALGAAWYFVVYKNNVPTPTSNLTPTPQPAQQQPQQTPQPAVPQSVNSNWKTYSNNQVGLSLKYPPNLNVQEAPQNYLNKGQVLGTAFYSSNVSDPEIQLAVYTAAAGGQKLLGPDANPAGDTFDSASIILQKKAQSSGIQYQVVTIDGMRGFRLPPFGDTTHQTVFLFGKNYDYLVDVRTNAGIDIVSLLK